MIRFATTLLLVTIAGAAAAWLASRVPGHPERIVAPAPLAPFHRGNPQLEDCTACHAWTERVPDGKCLACHEEIGRRREKGEGHHGRDLAGRCEDCHADHRPALIDFDRDAFNHRRALYALDGRHAEIECEACHRRAEDERFRYIGIDFATCTACHEDPHAGQFADDCARCHDERGWKGRHLRFAHDRDSKFRLRGKHADTACRTCHRPESGKALATARFGGLGQRCADCHEDPHGGQFARDDCVRCHGEQGFDAATLKFSHSRFEPFPLRGKHDGIACTGCHQGGRYRGQPHDCAACHEDPHRGQFQQTSCAECHDERGFEQPRIDHAHVFPLTGAHASVDCAKCHQNKRFRGVGRSCTDCHADPHKGTLAPRNCTDCHTSAAWTGRAVRFDHGTMSRFPLDAVHKGRACADCHEGPVFKPTPTGCAECHTEEAGFLEGRVGAARWAADPHAGKVGCTKCHDTGVARQTTASYAARCARCHTARYADLFVQRRAHLARLETRLRRKLKGRADARLETALRVGSHNFIEAEKRLRALDKER